VSTLEKAHNLRGLKDGWYVPIDEDKLRPFLLAMFNVDTKAYLKHIVPLLLLKELVHTTPETVTKNLVFDIQLAHKRGKDPNAEYLERPITFNPKKCTDLPLWTKPDNEDWKEDFDPTAPVETEFLEYVLVGALGEAEMERLKRVAGQPKPRKRKTTDVAAEGKAARLPQRQSLILLFQQRRSRGKHPPVKRMLSHPQAHQNQPANLQRSRKHRRRMARPPKQSKNPSQQNQKSQH
jgi:hypothetical protein